MLGPVFLCLLLVGTAVHGQTGGLASSSAAPASSSAAPPSSSALAATSPTTPAGGGTGGAGNPIDNPRCPGSTVVPDNGNLGTCADSVAPGATCTIACNSGFTITGSPKACPASGGALTGADQTCVGNPCTAPTATPENGALGTCTGSIAHGSSCSITCNDGFHIDGSNYKCFAGTLTGTQSCIGDPCPPLSTPPQDGGVGTCGGGGQQIAHGTSCSIVCDTGFTIVGDQRTCNGGKWSGVDQTCLGNPCTPLGAAPLHGQLGTCGTQVTHGSSCSITCDQGYQVAGSTSRTCKAGQFTGADQTCEGLPCSPLSTTIPNGELSTCGTQISHGGTCSITCHKGYHISGPTARTCTASVLGGDAQSCDGDPCSPILFPPENGNVGTCGVEIKHTASCDIACDDGYHREDGPFNCVAGVLAVAPGGKPQTCKGNSCGALATPPANGFSDTCGSAVAHQDSCSIICKQGFKLSDASPKLRRCVAGKYLDAEQECVVDPGYQAVQDMKAGFANVQALDAQAAADQTSIAHEEAIRAKVLADHAADVERQRKILFPPKPWENVEPKPHSYKPVDINNKYTYDLVYEPPQTSTDQKVLDSAKTLLGGLDALHEKRVTDMQTACNTKTCDYTASLLQQKQQRLSNQPLDEPNAVDVATNAPEPVSTPAMLQLNELLKRKRVLPTLQPL